MFRLEHIIVLGGSGGSNNNGKKNYFNILCLLKSSAFGFGHILQDFTSWDRLIKIIYLFSCLCTI